jgi:cystathionine beta-synthase
VTDRDAAIYTRKIVKDEGIFVGNSAGAAMAGLMQMKKMLKPSDVVVVIFHDHGTRYLGKMFNDDWMRERGFLVEEKPTAGDLLKGKDAAS